MGLDWGLPGWAVASTLAVALLAIAWSARQYARTEPAAGRWRPWLLGLRAGALAVLALAVAGPSLLSRGEVTRRGEVVLLVEDSASMAMPDAIGGGSRWQRALRLAAVADSLLTRRHPAPRVVLRRGNGLEALEPLTGAGPAPSAVGTDLAGLVREVAGRWADRPLRAVVLLSDGDDTAGRAAATAAALPQVPWSLITVGVGDPTGPPDLFVQDLRHPESVFAGERMAVEVTVAGRGPAPWPEGEIEARLLEDGRLLSRATAPPPGPDGIARLELSCEPEEPGLRVYRVVVSGPANERHLENNEASLVVDVRQRRFRLLLLTGRPDWSVRFLAQAAALEPRLELSVVRPGPDGPVLAGPQGPPRPWRPPVEAGRWRDWDGFVLAGWRPEPAGAGAEGLAAAVETGAGLLVLPGVPRAEPAPGRATPLAPPPDWLGPLLPVRLEAGGWLGGAWQPAETAAGAAHPVLAGVTHDVEPGQGLTGGLLPPLAAVVAAADGPETATLLGARPRAGGGEEPLLVLGRRGRGRVTWFGGYPLWEQAFWESPLAAPESEHPGRRLLRNLLVWTASGGEAEGPALSGSRTVYQEGERIRLEAVWRDLRGLPVTDRELAVRVEPASGESGFAGRTFAMEPVPEQPGWSRALLPPLPPGRYLATPLGAGAEPVAGRPVPLIVSPTSLEATQVRQDARRLRRLAAAVGGRHVAGHEPDAVERLAEALAAVPTGGDVRELRSRLDPAAGWPLLLVVAGLLAAEWALRRRLGML